MSTTYRPPPTATRLRFLDALRGVAITGIVFVNIPDMTGLGSDLPGADLGVARTVLDLTVQTRFVPIFEFLFGVGMWFIVSGARERGVTPWVPMVLRLTALFGIGFLHSKVYPGEVLTLYATAGLLVLPIVVLAPRWLQLGLGSVAAVTVFLLAGSSAAEVPGIMLLGAAAAAYGAPALLDRGARAVGFVFLAAAALSVAAVWLQISAPGDPRFVAAGGRAGLVMAVAYVTGLSLLWTTRARTAIAAVFEPIGRMALTNYVTASLVVVPTGLLLGFAGSTDLVPALVLGACVIAVQSVVSRIWLHHFRYGPLEWVWRAMTWRTLPRFTAG
ncbi:MAG TPA: DUF418 domain-containing protein [Pseudonocardia sp.]|jgi:uncharacterized membrane protein YeiB|nr:DUF418 domain-containing protein [Pseudonocardia sp.]